MSQQHDTTAPLSISIRAVVLSVVLAFVGAFLAFVSLAGPPARAQSTEASGQTKSRQVVRQKVIGRDCMRGCHNAIVESFALETHGKSAKFLKDSRAAKCDVCHSNSEKHSETSTQTLKAGD